MNPACIVIIIIIITYTDTTEMAPLEVKQSDVIS